MRRSKSQAPVHDHRHNIPSLGPESEQLAQLRSHDVFLTKTDTWSGAQVIQAVEDLNSEITHFADSAIESCVFERRTPSAQPPTPAAPPVPPKGSRKGRGKRSNRNSLVLESGRSTPTKQGPSQELLNSVPWLGPAFALILGTRDHAQDPMLVQLALQASVAICCARSLSLFCVGFPSKLDGLLSRVFTHMQGAGAFPNLIEFPIRKSNSLYGTPPTLYRTTTYFFALAFPHSSIHTYTLPGTRRIRCLRTRNHHVTLVSSRLHSLRMCDFPTEQPQRLQRPRFGFSHSTSPTPTYSRSGIQTRQSHTRRNPFNFI